MPDKANNLLEGRLAAVQKRKSWRGFLVSLLITALAVYLLFGVLFGIAIVEGDSMSPAFKDGDMVLFLRVGNSYQAGDTAILKMGDKKEYIKRIVALPGQTVDLDEETGTLLVDGETVQEPYIYEKTYRKEAISYPLGLKEKEYFVLGDHRGNSKDSRNYGPVLEKQLKGKVLLIFRLQF